MRKEDREKDEKPGRNQAEIRIQECPRPCAWEPLTFCFTHTEISEFPPLLMWSQESQDSHSCVPDVVFPDS